MLSIFTFHDFVYTSIYDAKTKNRHPPWCIPLSRRRRAACHTHGEVTRCRPRLRVFQWGELRSSWARIHWKYHPAREASIREGAPPWDTEMEIPSSDSISLWVRYCDILGELPRSLDEAPEDRTEDLLLPHSSEIHIRPASGVPPESPEISPWYREYDPRP